MILETWIAFTIAAAMIIIVPGPAALNQVRLGLNNNLKNCFFAAVGGTTIANTYLALAYWTIHLISSQSNFILWIQLAGCAYLFYLGAKSISDHTKADIKPALVGGPLDLYKNGAYVALSNPKDIFFFSALMPQFIIHSSLQEYIYIAVTWTILDVCTMTFYSFLAISIAKHIDTYKHVVNIFVGLCLIFIAIFGFYHAF